MEGGEGVSQQQTQGATGRLRELKTRAVQVINRLKGVERKAAASSANTRDDVQAAPQLQEGAHPPAKEASLQNKGLGALFQTRLSALDAQDLPPVLNESAGANGLLATNEDLPETVINQVRTSESAPNGYVFGAGFGNILSMPFLFPEGQNPRAILCVDVVPQVVLTGRIITHLLANSDTYFQFRSQLRNEEIMRSAYQGVIDSEQNSLVRERLRSTSFEQCTHDLQDIIAREFPPQTGIRQKEQLSQSTRLNILAVLRDNFDTLHTLAAQGNIAVGYANMINERTLETVRAMPGFDNARNIVYMSNVIDHLTQRGADMSHISDMNTLRMLGEGTERSNWFVDTTQKSQDYQLRAGQTVPQYRPHELI